MFVFDFQPVLTWASSSASSLALSMSSTVTNKAMLASSWLDQLLGLTRLSASDDNAQLGWRSPLPVWAWLFIFVGAFALAGWSYSRLVGSKPKRYVLAGLRGLLIVLVVALLVGPLLVVKDEIKNPDWLLVLVDRSASLNIRDVVQKEGDQPVSRDASLRQALAENIELFGPDQLGKDRRVVWLAFNSSISEINSPHATQADDTDDAGNKRSAEDTGQPSVIAQLRLPDADGQSTAIRSAIEQALQRAAGQPISGIVLFTDGRSPQTVGADTIARLKQQRIGIYGVPLGADKTPLNITIARVDVPQRAFTDDRVPVIVTIDKQPADAEVDTDRITVKLIDQTTDKVLDQKRVTQGLDKPITLSTRSELKGRQTWRVQVDYEPPVDATVSQRELVTDDNHKDIAIEFIDDPVRVLYIEGYPRWEYRYLKNMLIREKSIDSSMMLISADRAFAQEGNTPITRMPADAKELDAYDVIIIGDVPANYFGAELLRLMRDHISSRGAGVIWIGGQYFTPSSYDNTPLADLLPMRTATAAVRIDPGLGPIAMMPTPQARRLNVLRLRSDPSRKDDALIGPDGKSAAITWPQLPPFVWAQDVGQLKPTAEVLAYSNLLGGERFPLVSRMRYGGGQSIYLASDETWRWRYGRGELYFQQYWVQLIRFLRQQRLNQRSDGVFLDVSNRRVQLDQSVKLTLHVRDALVLQRNLSRITVAVTKADEPDGRVLDRIDLVAVDDGSRAGQSGMVGREYSAVWRTSVAGDLLLRLVEAGLDDLGVEETITVVHPDDERRQPATDHNRLAVLAKATGGSVVQLDELEKLKGLIPSRAERTENDTTEPLWHSPLALILIVFLITLEWIGRKMVRLV